MPSGSFSSFSSRSRGTILVVEDERDLVALLQDELSMQGYKVVAAENGSEGLELLQVHEPDLIICDRMMPAMSGTELLARIRGVFPQYRDVPFIFLTALNDPRDRDEVVDLKPYAYLGKPVDFDQLQKTVEGALATRL
ncbi:response regulator [Micavibrio aeruginosavorus]|uniref:Response regulator n=1 Tax=Micavibrio aeruginosavorus (strain ARL-13) TaxID=856793 RepID=G2KRH6_MICAA|nr:response regulator [Micavibrio aeruginosavorus]AEP09538.1 response regulator [Micavibrio aeruginosavorus ARL-13]